MEEFVMIIKRRFHVKRARNVLRVFENSFCASVVIAIIMHNL